MPLPGCLLYMHNVRSLTCKASCCSWTTCQLSGPNIPHHPAMLICLLWCRWDFGSAVFEKNFRLGSSYCLSNVCSMALNALFSTVQSSILQCHACTFGKSPSYSWLVASCSALASCARWQCTVFCRMVHTQMVMQICRLSIFCMDYLNTNPANHLRCVSWLSSFIWPKPKVLPDRQSGTFFTN